MSTSHSRPPIWVGHVVLESDRVEDSAEFMSTIGMRPIFRSPEMAIFELRGGTHLLIFPKGKVPGGAASFDLMVDDLRAFHQRLSAEGFMPTEVESVPAVHHLRFTVREPGGNVLTFFSSHVEGRTV
jgi:Glyoxalase/Bleomycin resistance protein/Dioxygenase superfamily